HHCIERIRSNRLFHFHAHQIAEQHRCWPHVELTQRHHWKLDGEAAGLPDTALDGLGERAEMSIAVSQFAPGIGDADDWPALKTPRAEAFRLEGSLPQPAVVVRW